MRPKVLVVTLGEMLDKGTHEGLFEGGGSQDHAGGKHRQPPEHIASCEIDNDLRPLSRAFARINGFDRGCRQRMGRRRFFNVVTQIFFQNGTMERADGLDVGEFHYEPACRIFRRYQ